MTPTKSLAEVKDHIKNIFRTPIEQWKQTGRITYFVMEGGQNASDVVGMIEYRLLNDSTLAWRDANIASFPSEGKQTKYISNSPQYVLDMLSDRIDDAYARYADELSSSPFEDAAPEIVITPSVVKSCYGSAIATLELARRIRSTTTDTWTASGKITITSAREVINIEYELLAHDSVAWRKLPDASWQNGTPNDLASYLEIEIQKSFDTLKLLAPAVARDQIETMKQAGSLLHKAFYPRMDGIIEPSTIPITYMLARGGRAVREEIEFYLIDKTAICWRLITVGTNNSTGKWQLSEPAGLLAYIDTRMAEVLSNVLPVDLPDTPSSSPSAPAQE